MPLIHALLAALKSLNTWFIMRRTGVDPKFGRGRGVHFAEKLKSKKKVTAIMAALYLVYIL